MLYLKHIHTFQQKAMHNCVKLLFGLNLVKQLIEKKSEYFKGVYKEFVKNYTNSDF